MVLTNHKEGSIEGGGGHGPDVAVALCSPSKCHPETIHQSVSVATLNYRFYITVRYNGRAISVYSSLSTVSGILRYSYLRYYGHVRDTRRVSYPAFRGYNKTITILIQFSVRALQTQMADIQAMLHNLVSLQMNQHVCKDYQHIYEIVAKDDNGLWRVSSYFPNTVRELVALNCKFPAMIPFSIGNNI